MAAAVSSTDVVKVLLYGYAWGWRSRRIAQVLATGTWPPGFGRHCTPDFRRISDFAFSLDAHVRACPQCYYPPVTANGDVDLLAARSGVLHEGEGQRIEA